MSQPTSDKKRMIIAAVILVVAGGVIFGITRSSAKNPAALSVAEKGPAHGPEGCAPTHCSGAACDACTAANCNPSTDGCDQFPEGDGRKLCEDAYGCFVSPASACLTARNQGDAIPCWCGSNMTTCWKSNEPDQRANGPCVKQVVAAAGSDDASTIRSRLVNPGYPLGRAINLSTCRGTFCTKECGFP